MFTNLKYSELQQPFPSPHTAHDPTSPSLCPFGVSHAIHEDLPPFLSEAPRFQGTIQNIFTRIEHRLYSLTT